MLTVRIALCPAQLGRLVRRALRGWMGPPDLRAFRDRPAGRVFRARPDPLVPLVPIRLLLARLGRLGQQGPRVQPGRASR